MKHFHLSLALVGFTSLHAGYASATSGNELTLDGLRAKCAELSADEQLKPFKAVVSCKQTQLEWRPAAQQAEPVKIENVKEIGASFSMKGYTVPFVAEPVEVSPSEASCQLWEQVKVTVPSVDLELDCEGLNRIAKISELCAPAIEEHLAANPALQQVETTGKVFNSCEGH